MFILYQETRLLTLVNPWHIFFIYKIFKADFSYVPTNTPCVFHVETSWKRSFTRRFNVE